MPLSTAPCVPFGTYFGFTLPELITELDRYKAEVKVSHSELAGSTTNGQTYSFGQRRDGTLKDWAQELQAAFQYLDPGQFPFDVPTNSAVVAFR